MRSSPANLESLARLVDLLYAAASDDNWDPFLVAVTDAVGGHSAALVCHDLTNTGGVAAFTRFDPVTARLYNEHFHTKDPFARSLRGRRPAERIGVFTGEMLISRPDFLRTEFYNDFCIHHDIPCMVTTVIQTSGDHQSGAVSGLTIQRRNRDRPFEEVDLPLLRALHPHLSRAMDVRHRLRVAGHAEQTLREVFDLLPAAALIVDRHARIRRANRRAERLLAGADGLGQRDGVLRALTSDDTARLHAACAAAATSDRGLPGATLTVRRPSPASPLRLLVSPLRPDDSLSVGAQPPSALVLVDDPDSSPRLSVDLLRQLYGFTKAEAEIAAKIGHGESLEEIAIARACSLQTVQWHNKRILGKVGCRSRRELVRRLSVSVVGLVGEP